MPGIKTIVILIFLTFCGHALSNQSDHNMNDEKTLVISYDYPADQVLKESTTVLHRNSDTTFHGDQKANVILLGEKQKIIIPGISESFLHFKKYFRSVTLYLLPTSHWSSLSTSIQQINQMKEKLGSLKDIAINSKEFDMDKLNDQYFKNKPGEVISQYELEHSKVFFIIKKLDTPKEIHPRDHDYFQLTIRIDNKIS